MDFLDSAQFRFRLKAAVRLTPGQHRLEVTVAAGAASWAVFGIGLLLAGRRGWVWLRRRWKGRRSRPGPPGPVMPQP